MPDLKAILDRFYSEYDFNDRIRHDPIEFPHRYKRPEDIEAVGFISCCLAYGKVELFKSVLERIFSVMGMSPYGFLSDFSVSGHGGKFRGIQYRFNKNQDILCLIHMLHEIYRKEGTIRALFLRHYRDEDQDIGSALAEMVSAFLAVDTTAVYGRNIRPAGLMQFFPSPEGGSACKRQNLFLRWMVRDRDIDFGIWKEVPKSRLIIPLDVHIMRISRCLGFTDRKSADWKTASEITAALKQFDHEDPLKYDFALCHHGISGLCRGKKGEETCTECYFYPPVA